MDENERREFKKTIRKADSRLKFRVETALTDLRNYWDLWSKEDRLAFKAWVTKLADLGNDMPKVFPDMFLRLEFSEQVGEDECHTFAPPIRAIKKAVDCWDRGEPYTPNFLGELSG